MTVKRKTKQTHLEKAIDNIYKQLEKDGDSDFKYSDRIKLLQLSKFVNRDVNIQTSIRCDKRILEQFKRTCEEVGEKMQDAWNQAMIEYIKKNKKG